MVNYLVCYVISYMGVPRLPAAVPYVWFCLYKADSQESPIQNDIHHHATKNDQKNYKLQALC
jgi:hypothetical protein